MSTLAAKVIFCPDPDFRFGSKPEKLNASHMFFRFLPLKTGHCGIRSACPFVPKTGSRSRLTAYTGVP